MNSTMSGRMYDRTLSQQALLGPRRPRPHKIWKKKFIKVGGSLLGSLGTLRWSPDAAALLCSCHDYAFTVLVIWPGCMHQLLRQTSGGESFRGTGAG